MLQTLTGLNDLLESIQQLGAQEKRFFERYIFELSFDLRRQNIEDDRHVINMFNLYDQSGANTYEEFILFLLSKCYDDNNDYFTRRIVGYCENNLPINDDIRDVLLVGLRDTNRSNQLRTGFLVALIKGFTEDAVHFYNYELDDFIQNNQDNPELVKDVLNSMTIIFYTRNLIFPIIIPVILIYLQLNPHIEEGLVRDLRNRLQNNN
jgi:hypothetical protein